MATKLSQEQFAQLKQGDTVIAMFDTMVDLFCVQDVSKSGLVKVGGSWFRRPEHVPKDKHEYKCLFEHTNENLISFGLQ